MRRNGDGLRWRMLALLLLLLLRRARSCMVRSEGGEGTRREEGIDERYDEVMSEIKTLEKGLDKSLKKLEDGVGFVEFFCKTFFCLDY